MPTNKEQMQRERDILTKNLSLSLIGRRLGNRLDQKHDPIKNLDGVTQLAKQLNYHGGYFQQNRMIRDKQKSLQKALLYSYQRAFVKKYYPPYDKTHKAKQVSALINPNRLTQDYNEKIISIEHEHEYKIGDVFEWIGTNTYWLIYLQQETELAYFRGNIRKCSYQISWKDGDLIKSTYAAVRGPVEQGLETIKGHGLLIDNPNYTLNILVPKNEDTLKQFKRYSKFYLSNIKEEDPICWRVEAIDSISSPGILEVYATEYFSNPDLDDIENGVINGLVQPVEDPNEAPGMEDSELILGETFIKPRVPSVYEFDGGLRAEWSVKNNKMPVQLKPLSDDNKIEVTWLSSYSGQFDLYYGDDIFKTIVVESLF